MLSPARSGKVSANRALAQLFGCVQWQTVPSKQIQGQRGVAVRPTPNSLSLFPTWDMPAGPVPALPCYLAGDACVSAWLLSMPSASSASSCTGWRCCPPAIPFCAPSQLCKSCAPRHPGIRNAPGTDHGPTGSVSQQYRADVRAHVSGPATLQPPARRVTAPQPCRCRSAWAVRHRARRSGRMRAPGRQSLPARWLCSTRCPAPPMCVAPEAWQMGFQDPATPVSSIPAGYARVWK